ncbi:ABC transporter ATP-binding protein [Burkholderia pseudomallei]|nr:ABC transporter ATP-binding protein [Burkholderia pseudomallei]
MIAELNNVKKQFKGKQILKNINLSINEKEIIGIIGGNGSGKTTILRLLSGLIYADSGEIIVNNKTIKKGEFPNDIGLLIETPKFIEKFTGLNNLKLLAKIQNKISEDEIKSMMKKMNLDPDLKDPVKTYSLGMNQRLGLIQAFMEKPKLLLLDEPTNALDEDSKKQFEILLKEMQNKGTAILLISHDKEEINRLCSKVYKLEEGILKEVVKI